MNFLREVANNIFMNHIQRGHNGFRRSSVLRLTLFIYLFFYIFLLYLNIILSGRQIEDLILSKCNI